MKLTACSAELLTTASRENLVDMIRPTLYDIAETHHRERMEGMEETQDIVAAVLRMMSARAPVQQMVRTATVLGMRLGWYARDVAAEREALEDQWEMRDAPQPEPQRAVGLLGPGPLRLIELPQRAENVAQDDALGG